MLTSNIFDNDTSSMSVTNLFPHSILCMAFLSISSHANCNLSAKTLCDMFRFFLKIAMFLPQMLFKPSLFLFINIKRDR